MKKMNYGSFSCEVSVTEKCVVISKEPCDYENDTISYAVERFLAQCSSLSKECTKISWQFRIVKGKSPKRQSVQYIIPAVLMELPGNWIKINGNIDAVGVNISRIELLHQHPCFENEIRQVC